MKKTWRWFGILLNIETSYPKVWMFHSMNGEGQQPYDLNSIGFTLYRKFALSIKNDIYFTITSCSYLFLFPNDQDSLTGQQSLPLYP